MQPLLIACSPDDMFVSVPFVLTGTVTHNGQPSAFSLAAATLGPGSGWTVTSQSESEVVLTTTQLASCYVGINASVILYYNAPTGVVPDLDSITLNISGVSTDGSRKIDGLVTTDGNPVVGPHVHDTNG